MKKLVVEKDIILNCDENLVSKHDHSHPVRGQYPGHVITLS